MTDIGPKVLTTVKSFGIYQAEEILVLTIYKDLSVYDLLSWVSN